MSTPIWPASLPQAPRVQGLSETMPDVVIRSGVDAGPAKVRRRISMNVRPWSMTLDLTAAQAVTLDQFFQVTTLGGSLRFTWKNPRTGNAASFRFVGQPVIMPLRNRVAGRFRAEFNLEQLPPLDATGVFQPAGGGGGNPVPTHMIAGTLGEFEFAEDSVIEMTLTSWCYTGTGWVYSNPTNRTITLTFLAATSAQITWQLEDGDGITQVVFNANTGWGHTIDSDHWTEASGCGETTIVPSTPLNEAEDFPVLRHYGYPEIHGANAGDLCSPVDTLGYGKTVDAVLQPGSSSTPSERASGYRAYDAVCGIAP